MMRRLALAASVAFLCFAAYALVDIVEEKNWRAATWCAVAFAFGLDRLWLLRHLRRPSSNRCTQCGRHRIGGGVFVAGVGPICFECEERAFGVDLDEATR